MSRVAVLTGGSSPERVVALAGASQVVSALRQRGHQVTVVDTVTGVLDSDCEAALLNPSVGIDPPSAVDVTRWHEQELATAAIDDPALAAADVVFLLLHGDEGEGGDVQADLEKRGIAYSGSDERGSRIAMDKDESKRLFSNGAIPTPEWTMWPASEGKIEALGLPLIVKPSRVGSTLGLTLVKHGDELLPAVALAGEYDDQILLEQYIPGREFTVGVLGGEALSVGEIIPQHELFDYECKYTPGMTREIFPAEIDGYLTAKLRNVALAAHRCLRLRDFSRVDFRVSPDGQAYVLEVNTLPGLTSASLFPQSARASGIEFPDLCDRICGMVLQRR